MIPDPSRPPRSPQQKKKKKTARLSNVSTIPIPGPKGICWKTGPPETFEFFARCLRKKRHTGKHQWEHSR